MNVRTWLAFVAGNCFPAAGLIAAKLLHAYTLRRDEQKLATSRGTHPAK
jgi:hypothetical protein